MDRVQAIEYIRKLVGIPSTGKKDEYLTHKEILQIALYVAQLHQKVEDLKNANNVNNQEGEKSE